MTQFPFGNSVMAQAIRDFDWSQTNLGSPNHWPESLRTLVGLLVESEFPKALMWGADLITFHNDAFLKILGEKPGALGRPFSEVWSEAWDSIGPIAVRAFEGEATYIEDFPLQINRSGVPEEAYFTFCYSPVRDYSGAVVGIMDTVVETTRTVLAKKNDAVLKRELAHRVKNIIAVTSAVVNSTLRTSLSLEDARSSVSRRIEALGRAQGLMEGGLNGITVTGVIRDTLTPIAEDWSRISLTGPDLVLAPQQNMALSLALYELGTNALKYGALSSEKGTVGLSWSASQNGGFSFEWVERGGPEVSPPKRLGFGSRLTGRIVPAYFNGEGKVDYQASGVRFSLNGRCM
ncbi:hypothetical protein WH87_04625 [Devosia epidermidihirudinis]|uniref:histidine kinase n=1 Tax=Devosia epidermidihirudinis TaxID=1293439 RepID=A0A0F5QGP9_9HYPH|nr:HWE histidine kinase domain-containing protein [Devosia epidermidihirudinis]KKC39888.1 hypothetical protein WH87_04625 [Devosia epidermidihirudinis]